MKKIISTLFALLLLAVLMPMSAFATEDEPVEYVPRGNITANGGENYIISKGNYTLGKVTLYPRSTLSIGKDVKITVNKSFENLGTINILGTLDVENCSDAINIGTIHVSCSGKIKGNISNMNGTVVYDKHVWNDGICSVCGAVGCKIGELEHTWENGVCTVCGAVGCKIGAFEHSWENGVCTVCGVIGCEAGELEHSWENGVCTVCGHECKNEFHNGIHACPDCGMEFDPTQGNPSVSGSIITEGNIAIITAVAGVAFGFVCGLLIGKKKKKLATAGVAEKEIKDEE